MRTDKDEIARLKAEIIELQLKHAAPAPAYFAESPSKSTELSEMTERCDSLKIENDKLRSTCVAYVSGREKLNSELNALTIEVDKCKKNIEKYIADVKSKDILITDLNQSIQFSNNEKSAFLKKINKIDVELLDVNSRLKIEKSKNEVILAELKLKNDEIKSLKKLANKNEDKKLLSSEIETELHRLTEENKILLSSSNREANR